MFTIHRDWRTALCYFMVLNEVPLTMGNPMLYQGGSGNATHWKGSSTKASATLQSNAITRIAAVGDSYSAGIGAGQRLGNMGQWFIAQSDYACSRYDSAYPYLVSKDKRLGDPNNRYFQFLSCSGAKIADVFEHQMVRLEGNQQVIMLSAGGNDAELIHILNQCVYQFFTVPAAAIDGLKISAKFEPRLKSLADYDGWDAFTRGCDGQLTRSEQLIRSEKFSGDLDRIIAAVKTKLGPSGIVYYTGYAKFWAEDYSPDCNNVSWSTWLYKVWAQFFKPDEKLTEAHRRKMNQLVDEVNARISAAVERAGPNVKFINYDAYVGYTNGRFCERGVNEATRASNTRPGLMFYELDWTNYRGSGPTKRDVSVVLSGTFEGEMEMFAQLTLFLAPDADFAMPASTTSSSTVTRVVQQDNPLSAILPDGYSRVFHPKVLLHQYIAQMIIWAILDSWRQKTILSESPGDFGSCSMDGMNIHLPTSMKPPPSGFSNGQSDPNKSPQSILGPSGPTEAGSASLSGQQLAWASYIHPLADISAWNRMIDYPSGKFSVLVANVINGPGNALKEEWATVINRAVAQNKQVIGYVRTGYLGVSWQKFKTRLNSGDLADWISQIQTDIELWYKLYPQISGIFFDEGWNECGPDNQYSELYRMISEDTKRKHPGAFTVLNPGAFMPQCFENSADTLMTFESNYGNYTQVYTPNPWTAKDPRKIWHIVYKVPAESVAQVVALARERGAGLIEINPFDEPNPYDHLPDEGYMQTLLGAVDGGRPLIADPLPFPNDGHQASTPSTLAVTHSDYSSVSLEWPGYASANAPLAFVVELDGREVTRIPGTMSRVTIGNLTPGINGWSLTVRAVAGDGSLTAPSLPVTANTASLPDGKTVTKVSAVATDTTTVYEADVLVPYGFVRLLITDPDRDCSKPAWPMNYDSSGHFVCAHYMVEGIMPPVLFKYTGETPSSPQQFHKWDWTPITNVSVEQVGYTFKWTIPVDTSHVNPELIDPNYFVIQTEGYGPETNVFSPCPSKWNNAAASTSRYCSGESIYDCKGEPLCSTTLVKWCDKAANSLARGLPEPHIYHSNGSSLVLTGNCWANSPGFGCKVYIQGPDCQISADDMWSAYQDIHNKQRGNCRKCGSKNLGNGCFVSVDHDYGCGNRDAGPRMVNLEYK